MAVISALAEHAELAEVRHQPCCGRQGVARRRALLRHPGRDQLVDAAAAVRHGDAPGPAVGARRALRGAARGPGQESQGRLRLHDGGVHRQVPRQGAALRPRRAARLPALQSRAGADAQPELPARGRRVRQGLALPLHRRCPGEPLRQPALPVRRGQPAAGQGPLRADAHRSRGRRACRRRAAPQEGREAAGAGARAPDASSRRSTGP
jgi:hypothetical protein